MKNKFFEEQKKDQDDLYGDFPDAKNIKSTKGNQQRPEIKVDIQYKAPTGFKFQFGYENNSRPCHLLVPDDQETKLITNKSGSI